MAGANRYLIKYSLKGEEGHFWTNLMVWDVEQKSIGQIFKKALEQAKNDASETLKKQFKDEEINIITFNLIDIT